MRQSLFFRLVGALLVPLYATGAWIAPTLQVCPMHGSPAAAHVMAQMGAPPDERASAAPRTNAPATEAQVAETRAADTHAAVAPSMDGHVMSGTSGVAQSASLLALVIATDAPAGEHSHGCDCIGCCASSNGPAVPSTALAWVAPVEQNTVRIEMQHAGAVVTRIAHVLPFATAPPKTLV